MFKFFAAADISKNYFDVAYWSKTTPVYLARYSNDQNGFTDFYTDLKSCTSYSKKHWFICFENTGSYSKELLNWLSKKQIACKEENALVISRSRGIRRGKSDKIDALAICKYLYEKRDSIKPDTIAKPVIRGLKKLLSRRSFLVKQKVAHQVSVKEQLRELEPDIAKLFKAQSKEILQVYQRQIKDIEQSIEVLIKHDKEVENNYKLARSVKGIGKVISAYIIATTNNFTLFNNARKYACYSGIAPFPNSSGNYQGKTKVSHMANKKIKSLLSNGVQAAIQSDPEIQNYYNRKISEGKEKGTILNAIKNKLIHRVFATVKRQSPYVTMQTYR